MSPGESQQRHQLSGVDRFRRYRQKGSAIWSLGKANAFALSRSTIAEGGASTGREYEVVSQKQPMVIEYTGIV